MKRSYLSRKQRRNMKRKAIGLLCLTMATSSFTVVGPLSNCYMGAKPVEAATIDEEGATVINIRRIDIKDGHITCEIKKDGKYVLTGSNLINGVRVPTQITVAKGVKADIIVDNLNIENTSENSSGSCNPGGDPATIPLTIYGNVNMNVKNDSNIAIKGGNSEQGVINVSSGGKLVIDSGDKKLNINGDNAMSFLIEGDMEMNAGNLSCTKIDLRSSGRFFVNGGSVDTNHNDIYSMYTWYGINAEIVMNNGELKAGLIGQNCKNVIINHGKISAANIGWECENVTINGGNINVEADSITYPAIGSSDSNALNLIINGGNIVASAYRGNGIGGQYGGDGSNITITGGNISASSGEYDGVNSSAVNANQEAVLKHEITLDGIDVATEIDLMKLYTEDSSYYYGTEDMVTDNQGKLCIYISDNVKRCDIIADGKLYTYDYNAENESYEIKNTGNAHRVDYVDAEDGSVITSNYADRTGNVQVLDNTEEYDYSLNVEGTPFDGTGIDTDTVVTVEKTKHKYVVTYTGDYEAEEQREYGEKVEVPGYKLFNADGTEFTGTVTSDCTLEAVTVVQKDGVQYYDINSLDAMMKYSDLVNSGKELNGMVTQDISITSSTEDGDTTNDWNMIGTKDHPFKGIFDGNNKKITLSLTNTGENAVEAMSLFGYVNQANIKNVITSGVITTSKKYSGGIIGEYTGGQTTIEHSGSDVKITYLPGGYAAAGGIVGYVKKIKLVDIVNINNCYYTGSMESGTIDNPITGQGGIIGHGQYNDNINNCFINASFNGEMENNVSFEPGADYGDDVARGVDSVNNCVYVSVNGSRTQGSTAVTKEEINSNKLIYILNTSKGSSESTGIWTMGANGPEFATGEQDNIHKVTIHIENRVFADETIDIYTNADGTFVIPDMSSEDGYTFVGLFDGENQVTAGNVINKDCELNARYDETVAHALGRLDDLSKNITSSVENEGGYTQVSIGALNNELEAANEMIKHPGDNLTVENVKEMAREIYNAYNGLAEAKTVKITGDYNANIEFASGQEMTLPDGYIYYDRNIIRYPGSNTFDDTVQLTSIKAVKIDDKWYCEINSADQLIKFANLVNNGLTSLNGTLTNDVVITSTDVDGQTPVWNTIGRYSYYQYTGTFNGQHHTVTLNLVNTSEKAIEGMSLFGNTSYATIENVNTTGSIETTKKFAAGIVGQTYSTNITECSSDMDIVFVPGGDATVGGIIGINNSSSNTTLRGCSYTGSMRSGTEDVAITGQGGLIGWNSSMSTYVYNCYVNASFNGEMAGNTEFIGGSSYGDDLARNDCNSKNSYYVKKNGSTRGSEVSSEDIVKKSFVYQLNNGNNYWACSENGPVRASADNKAVHKIQYKVLTQPNYQAEAEESIYTSPSGTVVLPDSSTNEDGYEFMGWYNGDIPVDENTVFDEDTVLTAKFNETVEHLKLNVAAMIDDYNNKVIESDYSTETFKVYSEKLAIVKTIRDDTENKYTYDEIDAAIKELSVAYNNLAIRDGILTLSSNVEENELKGAGRYTKNTSVTISAKQMEGYNFLGWYDENDNLISKNLEYTFVYNSVGDRNYTAKYEALPSKKVTLTLGDDCSINGEANSENIEKQFTTGTKVTLKASNADGTFLYWIDENGNVVSKNAEYTFIVTGDVGLTSVYNKPVVEENVIVEFKNDFGQVLSRAEYAKESVASDIVMPDAPSKNGYTFIKWSMSADEIVAALAAGETITVTPLYAEKAEYYKVNLVDAQIVNATSEANEDGEYRLSTNITVKANSPYQYDKFSHWEDGEGNILGYCEEYYGIVTKDMTLKAVYVDVTENVEQKAVVNMTATNAFTENGVNKISFTYTRNIPEEFTMLSHGLLVTSDETVANDEAAFVSGTTGVKKATANTTAHMGTFTVNMKNPVPDQKYYARAYVIYVDKNGNQITIYSDVESVVFSK